MAADWIKIRVWLKKDPKVIAMADLLAVRRDFMDWISAGTNSEISSSAYQIVTRDIVTALCVTSLVTVWGTSREQGSRVDDDLIVDFCNCETLSIISEVPGFGQAMCSVGWAIELSGNRINFPKFFLDKEPPSKRHDRSGAERQARYRERQRAKRDETVTVVSRDVTRNGDVTLSPLEERRGDKEVIEDPAPSKRSADVRQEAETLYQLYPRRIAKGAALKAISKALSIESFEVLRESVEAYSTSRVGQDPQFTPHPATWFNAQRWKDDRATWEPSATQRTGPGSPGFDDGLLSFAAKGVSDEPN